MQKINENEFLELFNNPLLKTSSVTRFSGVMQNNKESLSDHITDVCSLSYLIGRKLISKGVKVDLGKLLERCVVHDFDEVLVGDIPRLTKYATKEVHSELNKVAEIAAKGISESIDGSDYTYKVWRDSKDDSLEGFILKVVDILSVTKKVIYEIDFSHNLAFCKVAEEVGLYVSDLSVEVHQVPYIDEISADYLDSILVDTAVIMKNIYDENRDKIISYKIVDDITSYILSNRDTN